MSEKRWQERRRVSVTATDVAAIMGKSKWKDRYSLMCKKMGWMSESYSSGYARFGIDLEPVCQLRCQRDFPLRLVDPGDYTIQVYRPQPEFTATCDMLIEHDGVCLGVVEIKTSSFDRIPFDYWAQVQWQMMVTDTELGYIAQFDIPSEARRDYPEGNMKGYIQEVVNCNLHWHRIEKDLEFLGEARDMATQFLANMNQLSG